MPEQQSEISPSPESPAEVSIKVDNYFIRHMGLLSHQTVLKLGEYNLHMVPVQMGSESARLLVVLTAAEVTLFSRFTDQLHTLTLLFEGFEGEDPSRLHIKTNLISITPLPERKDVCLVHLKFKSRPSEYLALIEQFLSEQKVRKEYFSTYQGENIVISPGNQALLGYNGYCEAGLPEMQRVALRGIGLKSAVLASPQGWGPLKDGQTFPLKLYFKKFQFLVEAQMTKVPENPRGETTVSLGFSNELMDILEDYKFRLTILKKKAAGGKAP